MILVTVTGCVLLAVQTEVLNIIWKSFRFQRVNSSQRVNILKLLSVGDQRQKYAMNNLTQ
jgi:hypothetical protein